VDGLIVIPVGKIKRPVARSASSADVKRERSERSILPAALRRVLAKIRAKAHLGVKSPQSDPSAKRR